MARFGGVNIPIDVDPDGAIRGIRRVESGLDHLDRTGSQSLGRLKTAGLAAGAAVGAGLATVFSTGVREMIEFEKVAARTANVIETTGGKAGITAKHVEDLANSIQELTGTEDDLVQAGANVLLTFTQIGAKGGVFDRALKITNDLSVATGRDLTAAARQVGRALNDPVKGLIALTRAGVSFTAAEQDQIKALAESGKLRQAQIRILNALEQRFKGAAQSEGDVTEATQKLNREFEEFSETTVGKLIPALQAFFSGGNRVEDELESMRQAVRSFVRDSAVSMRTWATQVANSIKRVSTSIGSRLGSAIRDAASTAFTAARDIGIKIVDGIKQGFIDAWHRVTDWISSAVKKIDVTPGFDFPGLAVGGAIPGRLGQAVPIMAHAGEVVLNPEQQRQVGASRIMEVLRRTGGVVGGRGSRMASGGVVAARQSVQGAYSFAKAQVGERYGRPDRGTGSRVGPDSWDCSGFATSVAGQVRGFPHNRIGGTTFSERGAGTGVRSGGSEPIIFGFRGSGDSAHMGVRVLGQWFDSGGGGFPGVAQGENSDGSWEVLEIPVGLDWTAQGDPERFMASGRDIGEDPTARRKIPKLTKAQALRQTRKLLQRTGAFGTASPQSITEQVGESIETRHRDDPVQEHQFRAAGEAGARLSGITNPEKIAKEGDLAILRQRKVEIDQDVAEVKDAAGKVRTRIKNLRGDLKGPRGLYARLKKTRLVSARTKIINQINAKREQIREAIDELHGLVKQAADLQADATELGFEIGDLVGEIAALPDAPPPDTSTDSTAETGPTADQAAQQAQADERARVAERNALASEAFIRTLFTSSSIDPASGATVVNINVEGNLVRQGELASWIVGLFGNQGGTPASSFSVGA